MMVTQEDQRAIVEVDADGLRAYLRPVDPSRDGIPEGEDLRSILAEAGVVRGIMAGPEIRAVPENGRVLVAVGRPPVRGADGWVEFPTASRGGAAFAVERVNMRDGDFLKRVSKGDVVALIHPPAAGEAGETVRGEAIPAEAGAPAHVKAGDNVAASLTDPGQLVAAADGHLAFDSDGRIEVQTVVTIPGNLDLTVGNIDFCGSIIVLGDIMSDFTVNVGGSLDVRGNVEDSLIKAGGGVTVRNGFYGHGKGTIEAGGDVRIHHILNQSILSEKDVYIETEAVNATVRAGGRIIAPRAIIAGGTMDALREIVAGVLGSEDGGQAKLRAGKRGRILERLGQIDRDIKHGEKQLTDVKATVYRFVKMKVDGVGLNAEQEQALGKLQEVQKLLPVRLEALQAERVQLQAELQKKAEARIEVHDTVHENVLIDINNVRKVIDSAIQGVVFTERAGTIEIQSR
jgi:uncharacterized protein